MPILIPLPALLCPPMAFCAHAAGEILLHRLLPRFELLAIGHRRRGFQLSARRKVLSYRFVSEKENVAVRRV